MKKKKFLFLSVFLSIILIVFLIRAFSFELALWRSGLSTFGYNTIVHSFNNMNNCEYKVISTSTDKSDIVLVHLQKNKLGFWKVREKKEYIGDDDLVRADWMLSGGSKGYDYRLGSDLEHEIHIVYCGKNAIRLIEFLPGQLPENTTANIQQAGDEFQIHLISFVSDFVEISNFDVKKVLEENKCIPTD